MIGHVTPGSLRAEVLAALRRHFLVAPVAGFVSPPEMMDLYRLSRAVINIPLADDLNMRAFEALGARSILVTGPMDGADRLLGQLPVVVVPGSGPAEWVDAVRRTIERGDQERADAGFRLVTNGHTYDKRADVVLAALVRPRPTELARSSVADALAQGWARWGDVAEVWRLTQSPGLAAKALGWRALSTGKVFAGAATTGWVHRHS